MDNNSLIALAHASLNGEDDALNQINDVFEENGLDRVDKKHVVYYCCMFDTPYLTFDTICVERMEFIGFEAKKAFVLGLRSIYRDDDVLLYYGDTIEEVKQQLIDDEIIENE